MTVLDRLIAHDAWTTRQLLLRCRELSEEKLRQNFDIGNKSLHHTFQHLISCMEKHVDLMLERTDQEAARSNDSVDSLLARLSSVAKDFAQFASKTDREGTADDLCVSPDGDKLPKGSLIAHLITHSMHHRAQILYIMERLGIENGIEGDALGWEGQARGWGYRWCGSYGDTVAE